MNNLQVSENSNAFPNSLVLYDVKKFFHRDGLKNSVAVFSAKKIFKHKIDLQDELIEAVEETHAGKNLHGPFKTAEDAVASMLAD